MKSMREHFDEEAGSHDRNFLQAMGLGEFYDAVEAELNECVNRRKLLVLGCGSGLEIERIKFPAEVVGVDISEKMLEVLKSKELFPGVSLTTTCSSFLDTDYGTMQYDIVLACYAMHHLNPEQKQAVYGNIFECLRSGGVFIAGDIVARDLHEEEALRNKAGEAYRDNGLPFGSLHIDVPFCAEHETAALKAAGFRDITIVREWTNTKLFRCVKG